jgi:hypothetical protein
VKREGNLKDPGVEGRTILKAVLNKWDVLLRTELVWITILLVTAFSFKMAIKFITS